MSTLLLDSKKVYTYTDITYRILQTAVYRHDLQDTVDSSIQT